MIFKINSIYKNLHLLISLIIVIPTAIIYGSPSLLPRQLNIQVNTVDLSNMLRAIMCLYVGISIIWILGVIKENYWKIATQLNILFMLSLAFGRIISMLLDGLPTSGYIFGVIAELFLGILSIYQLKRFSKN